MLLLAACWLVRQGEWLGKGSGNERQKGLIGEATCGEARGLARQGSTYHDNEYKVEGDEERRVVAHQVVHRRGPLVKRDRLYRGEGSGFEVGLGLGLALDSGQIQGWGWGRGSYIGRG